MQQSNKTYQCGIGGLPTNCGRRRRRADHDKSAAGRLWIVGGGGTARSAQRFSVLCVCAHVCVCPYVCVCAFVRACACMRARVCVLCA